MSLSQECKNMFMELQKKKVYKFIVFKIDKRSKLVMDDQVGDSTASYEELTSSLPDDDCRYAVFDFDFVTDDNCKKSKIFFIAWSPDASSIREKFLYASSKLYVIGLLGGIHQDLRATDSTEMTIEVIRDMAK